jgi:competence ComEA-like helix-hairpin-helix protein
VPVAAAGKDLTGVVNLNTAEPRLLVLLPGVGGAKAAQIVAYRARHPFRTVDELVRIKGIGRRMVRALRPHLAVAGPSTANPISRSGASRTLVAADVVASSGPPPGGVAIPTTSPRPVATSLARQPGPGKQPPPAPSRPLRKTTPASRASPSRANHCAPGP